MKSIITGGAGFIGSHLADELINRGHEVIIIDDLSGGFERNIPQKANFFFCDITDKHRVNECFDIIEPDYVFHLGAFACEGLSHHIKNFMMTNIVLGSMNLINASVNHKVKRFINFSSMAVYGSAPAPFTEETKKFPEDTYGIGKLAVEMDLECTYHKFGMERTTFNPHNVYGSRQNIGDTFRNVIGIFMNQIMKGEPMTIFGDGTQIRAFSHISDIIPYIADCIDLKHTINQHYNVGGDIPYTINQLAETLQSITGKGEIIHLEPRFEVHTAYCDHTKLKRDFQTHKQTPLEEGLKEMRERAKELGPQAPSRYKDIEIVDKLLSKRLNFID